MTTKEIVAAQLSEIYGFELEQVQTTAGLIADALDGFDDEAPGGERISW
jgi:hypothetical protein